MESFLLFLFVLQVWGMPQPPNHSFEKRVFISKKAVHDEDLGQHVIETKKVFVTYVQGPYTFKKRREKGNRVTFSCNGCQKFQHYLPLVAVREQLDNNPENDIFTLDIDTLPGHGEHVCASSGIEDLVRKFKQQVEELVRLDPTQPMPALYLSVRSTFTKKLSYDAKNLFLSEIPSYDSLQSSMYRIRREFIPAAPSTQAELDTSLDWFLLHDSQESMVKGDILHSDGLRVLLFASDESLKIMARARTILADGTFRITPYLWYQTFILSAEFRENSFVPVAFGLLPDKKRYLFK